MKRVFCCLVGVLYGFAAARADIAAVEHEGHNIIAVDAPTIRMVSAKVDITWGEPGKLSAVFVMDNESAEAADVQLGFPVSLPEKFRKKGELDFTMSFDGVPIERAAVRQDTPAEEENGVPNYTLWFHCRHCFPPGSTTVKVDTKLPATAAYRLPFRENLFYRIDTGAGWKGPIGSEEVSIHFPRPLRPEDIEKSEPPGAVLNSDTVRWRFENFKPEGHDHDISLQFLHPCVLPILDDLRQQSAKAPRDLHKKLNLIKHLLALCNYRNSFPEPPQNMTRQENERILAMLRSDADRAQFQKLFVLEPDGLYWPQDENDELSTMLSAVGYVPPGAQSKFLVEGRELLTQFLRDHPHNADAWNIHLLHFAGYPGEPGVAAFQMEQIKIALRNCPDDPTIRLWNAYGRRSRQRQAAQGTDEMAAVRRVFTKRVQLTNLLEKRDFFDMRFKQRSYDYYQD